ncbi:hypothetical protein SOVF_148220 [Spinacia oleracea]|uniref:Glycosyltransferase n=1 Tax=Spinacia oleracea TaxID=3562 RepID=A0A9R0I9S1_SPIOL|nr:cyanidin 3-O-galactoside 2''-O-xylosyltransferase FGGT1-like [Spinacia oleracea]KNA10017.1 hypothetical protein SOVF_148220 [Spinacia oleracea]
MCDKKTSSVLNIAFYPWFALGHLTSYLRLANKLAQRGHNISYFIPTNTQPRLVPNNHYPDHLTFIPVSVPPVDGLPPGAETTNDVPSSAIPLLMTAMDLTRDTIEAHLVSIKSDMVFYDLAYWIPELARKHGFKSVHYMTTYIASCAYFAPGLMSGHQSTGTELIAPPPGFPSQHFRMQAHESEVVAVDVGENQDGLGLESVTIFDRLRIAFGECDAIGVKSCKEMEGVYIEYCEKIFGKPVLLAGPMVPETPSSTLDDYFDGWLKGFGAATLIYCAFGSECVLDINQFQHLLLGLELTGRPFLVAMKPPKKYETIESALPEGFEKRTKGRGIVHEGWVQQQLILQHPSVGCFITHCGVGSLSEAMVSKCQVVLMPQAVDQFINARMMSLELKIGVEVEKREDDGLFTKEAVHKAVSLVMEEESEVAKEMRVSHDKWREFLLQEGLEDSYISSFIQSLRQLIG